MIVPLAMCTSSEAELAHTKHRISCIFAQSLLAQMSQTSTSNRPPPATDEHAEPLRRTPSTSSRAPPSLCHGPHRRAAGCDGPHGRARRTRTTSPSCIEAARTSASGPHCGPGQPTRRPNRVVGALLVQAARRMAVDEFTRNDIYGPTSQWLDVAVLHLIQSNQPSTTTDPPRRLVPQPLQEVVQVQLGPEPAGLEKARRFAVIGKTSSPSSPAGDDVLSTRKLQAADGACGRLCKPA